MAADLSDLTHALDWAATLVRRRQAILRAGELPGARRAAETLQTFLRNLTRALDGPPTEDVILGCPHEPGPHLLRFHRVHADADEYPPMTTARASDDEGAFRGLGARPRAKASPP